LEGVAFHIGEIATLPKASQLFPQIEILDPLGFKIPLEILLFKMWESTRRKAPNIHSDLNLVFLQKRQEFVEGSGAGS
jgi:hypothetical protein